eukprot:4293512-Amphidinium_carterae.1
MRSGLERNRTRLPENDGAGVQDCQSEGEEKLGRCGPGLLFFPVIENGKATAVGISVQEATKLIRSWDGPGWIRILDGSLKHDGSWLHRCLPCGYLADEVAPFSDIGGILTLEVHDKLAQVLVKELTRSPPAGCQNLTVDQIAGADVEAWKFVSRFTSGLQPKAIGKSPVYAALEEVLVDPALKLLLLRLPIGQPSKRHASSRGHDEHEEVATKKPKKSAAKRTSAPHPLRKLPAASTT